MLPTTFEEACASRGYDSATVLPDVSKFPVKHQKAITAYAMLVIIAESINEGHEPDWNDRSERKWIPWFDMEVDKNNPSGFRCDGADYDYTATSSAGGSRLCFRSEESCEYAATKFIDLWRDMMVILK